MDDEAVQLLMGDYAERFRTRPGGYTRVLKLGRPRPGDNASMAVIALVDEAYEPNQASPSTAEAEASGFSPVTDEAPVAPDAETEAEAEGDSAEE